MLQIDIGTINIHTVSQAGSVNIGNTLNIVEKGEAPPSSAPREGLRGPKKTSSRPACFVPFSPFVFPPMAFHPAGIWRDRRGSTRSRGKGADRFQRRPQVLSPWTISLFPYRV